MRLMVDNDFVAFQETHATEAEAELVAERCSSTHFCAWAATAEGVSGELFTMIRRDWCAGGHPVAAVVLPGRVLHVRIPASQRHAAVHVLNVHNVGVRAAVLRAIADIVQSVTNAGEPLLAGDFSFSLERVVFHCRPWRIRRLRPESRARQVGAGVARRHSGAAWSADPRCGGAPRVWARQYVHSSLDRVYTKLSPLSKMQLDLVVHVSDIGLALHSSSHTPLSDHVPVVTAIRPRDTVPPHRRPIPGWVVSSDEFAARAPAAVAAAVGEGLHPHDAWRRAKQALRKAAAAARDAILSRGSAQPMARCQLALQTSRAVHPGDPQLMRKVLHAWPEVRAAVQVVDSQVQVVDAGRMQRLIGEAVARLVQPAPPAADLGRSAGVARRRRPPNPARTATARQVKLWAPHARRVWLGVVLGEDADAEAPIAAPSIEVATNTHKLRD